MKIRYITLFFLFYSSLTLANTSTKKILSRLKKEFYVREQNLFETIKEKAEKQNELLYDPGKIFKFRIVNDQLKRLVLIFHVFQNLNLNGKSKPIEMSPVDFINIKDMIQFGFMGEYLANINKIYHEEILNSSLFSFITLSQDWKDIAKKILHSTKSLKGLIQYVRLNNFFGKNFS